MLSLSLSLPKRKRAYIKIPPASVPDGSSLRAASWLSEMLAACEAGEVFALLEGRDAADAVAALYNAVREPWLTRALLMYHARTGATRALDLLARAPEPHTRHLLDALLEQLRGDRQSRHHALAALAPLVARRPPWLHRLPGHPLAAALLRAARIEREPLPLLHALLTLAALLHAAPALAAPHWPELADAMLRPAALEPPPAPPARAHLQLAQLALFHALYATHPCTLIETLRAECNSQPARDCWERGLSPLLHSVRLHPALVTGSRQREADSTRWTRHEIHDVVAESRRLSTREHVDERVNSASVQPLTPVVTPSPVPGSGAHAARAAAALRPGAESWFALTDRCGADSAPHTPLPAETDVVEPPEAAVEATPENTPAKETRAQFRFPGESGAVRAIGLRKEASPPGTGDAVAGRLARVAIDRRAADSPVPLCGAPPPAGASVARPQPSRATLPDTEPLNVEDREVLELTARSRAEETWPEVEAVPRARDPRRLVPRRRAGAGAAPPPRRAASCSARLPPARTHTVAVQTLDTWPAPYEFLIADFYRGLPGLPDTPRQSNIDTEKTSDHISPCERLDKYLTELYSGKTARGENELSEQLALAHAQLLYERWRREAHAERNRRLLGRCRQARALELQNAALRERLRVAQLERDELRARLARETPAPVLPVAASEREAQLEAALAEESAARLRAEAALREAEAQRALDEAELQRTRGESFEASRHVEALARAALAAERRAEHVRRLRRELLMLAERETRLADVARAAAATESGGALAERRVAEERALKAALARAEAEVEASVSRADAATARAHELEAALSARDAAAAELKRALRHAADEHAARQRALQDKYAALLSIIRTAEARKLERLAGGVPRATVGTGGAGGPVGSAAGPVGGAGGSAGLTSGAGRLQSRAPPA
ncbi:unnamed protein product [Parnassius apollo]|uniref:(apollo) hypothetical protein n=1 Tax=Parnassius apollo TaxID=110799 RepID=A0A8S3YDD8_PARAO|nr:unnamed protein product [Parnassius apollo]